jgi:PKHD-type hydroxylase
MLLAINGVLNEAQLAKVRDVLGQARFQDGRLTAGRAAGRVKNNEELAADAQVLQLVTRIVMSALGHSPDFRNAALPHRVAELIVARYQPGMTYGDHVDDPIMGTTGPRFRSDVSMTLFLNPPDSYDGGELVLRTPFGDRQVKLTAGDAVVYPSSSVHQVAPVTRGERLVVLTWIQSYVRDAARRELLFELNRAREHLLATDPDGDAAKQVDRSYANLLRMWAEV